LAKYQEAEEIFRKALTGREKKLGKDHADTLTTVNHLGVLLKQLGNFREAEECLRRALNGFEEKLGPDHLCTAEAAYNFAVLRVQQGLRRQARDLFTRSLKGLVKSLGNEHQHTLDALYWEDKCKQSATDSSAGSVEEGAETVFNSKSTWVHAPSCEICSSAYTLIKREHHCRVCSKSVCNDCSMGKTLVLEFDATSPVRYCSTCEQQGF
jgi:tetratricopeptide (TPR) repeat protein